MVKVWDLGVRAFHWLLVLAVLIAAVTGFFGPRNALDVHIAAGATIAALVALRLVWGFAGPTYARFASFLFGPATIVAYAKSLLRGRPIRYLGHNPLGGMMVFALLVILALIVFTGTITLGGVDKQGPLALATSYATGSRVHAIHQVLAYLLMAMVVAHLAGVIHGSIAGHERLVAAMLSGAKRSTPDARTVKSAIARPAIAAVVAVLLLGGTALGVVALSARPGLGVPVGALDPTYVKECGTCHMAFPPSLSPSTRWVAVMNGLDDHFGEEASLTPAIKARILIYLKANAAEHWDTRSAHVFAATNPADPLRVTATRFWIRMHGDIPDAIFKSKAVGAKSACNACHGDAATGRFDPQNIAIPEAAFR